MNIRRADPRLLTILVIVFVQIAGAALILPVLPLFAQDRFAMSPPAITLLVASFFAAQFLAGPWLGRLSDRHGRLPVLVFSQIGTAISFVVLALATGPGWLFAGRILDGITGGNIIVAQAYVTDITPPDRRTQSLGLIFAAFGLGFSVGPVLGGVIAAAAGSDALFFTAAGAAALTVVLTWLTLDESLTPDQRAAHKDARQAGLRLADVGANARLVRVLAIAFVGQFALGTLQSTFALFGAAVLFRGASASTTQLGIGLLLTVIGVTQLLTQAFVLRWAVARFGDGRLVVIGGALRAVSLMVFALVSSPWAAAAGAALFALGTGLSMPSLQSIATRVVADAFRGGALGWYQSALSLSTIFSTAFGGVLFAVHPRTPYWVGAALAAAAVVPALSLSRAPAGEPAAATAGR